MNQIKGKNFSIGVAYGDLESFVGVAVRLAGEEPEQPRAVAARIDIDATHGDVADAFEQLAQRIRGLV